MKMQAEALYIYDPTLPDPHREVALGGKAASLLALQQEGFPVPDFWVIPAGTLSQLLPDSLTGWEAIRSWIQTAPEVGELVLPLMTLLQKAGGQGPFAVRSSALGEDAMGLSYAGIFESVLEVTHKGLEQAIRTVWASAWSSRVQTYHQTNERFQPVEMAILVQKMVPAEVAGVVFGINPVTGNRKEKLISATPGLGDRLVTDLVEGDRYLLQEDGNIQSQPEKEGGTLCLTEAQVKALGKVADQVRSVFHYYPDIEFAYANEKLWVLQSRPISQSQLPLDPDGTWAIWDRSNIMESYPGHTSPLTYSFVRRTYQYGYFQLAEFLFKGTIPDELLERNKPYFENMVGLIEGRLHYNLMTYYHLLSIGPGFQYTSRFLEGILGVMDSFDFEPRAQVGKWKERWRMFRIGTRLIWRLSGLKKSIRIFEAEFEQVRQEFWAQDMEKKSPHDLMFLYKELERTVVARWKPPVVNGFFTMIFFGLLRSWVKKWKVGGENFNIHNDLLVGEGNIISTEPVRLLVELTEQIRQNQEAEALFRAQTPEQLVQILKSNPFPEIGKKIEAYLEAFGERCIGGELKLENVPYKTEPAKFLKILKSYLDQEVKINFEGQDLKVREEAEQVVRENMKGKPVKRRLFFRLVKLVRFLVANRENLRYTRTQAWGMVREIFVRLGGHLFAEGILDSEKDVFWLTKEELFDFVQGTSVNKALRPLVVLRKEQYARFEAAIPRERIITKGVVYDKNDFYAEEEAPVEMVDGQLTGVGCCAGRVKGRVRVVLDPDQIKNLDGDILVAHSTDPGWVKLFPTASAILLERGSLLSHTGIVTREMGIPCVVSIKGLIKTVKDGDLVEMDGRQGWVRVIRN